MTDARFLTVAAAAVLAWSGAWAQAPAGDTAAVALPAAVEQDYPPGQKPEISVNAGVDCLLTYELSADSFRKWQADKQTNPNITDMRSTTYADSRVVFDLKLPKTAIVDVDYTLSLLWQERSNPRRKKERGTARFMGATGELPALRHTHEGFYTVDGIEINRLSCASIVVKVPPPPPCECGETPAGPPKTEDERLMDTLKDEEFMKRFIEEGK